MNSYENHLHSQIQKTLEAERNFLSKSSLVTTFSVEFTCATTFTGCPPTVTVLAALTADENIPIDKADAVNIIPIFFNLNSPPF